MLTIVNYGSGNIHAFANVYDKLGVPYALADTPDALDQASKIILPGVGVFDETIARLESSGFVAALNRHVLERSVPILGVCVGMQIMADTSEEGALRGLGWIPGKVVRFPETPGRLLPHMGWNDARVQRATQLFAGLEEARFYFLHSYHFKCSDSVSSIAVSDYDGAFTCAVAKGNVFGVQFHPEKSHRFGVQLLRNFANL